MAVIYGEKQDNYEVDNTSDIAEKTGLEVKEVERLLKPDNILWYDDPLVRNLIEKKDPRIVKLARVELNGIIKSSDRESKPGFKKQVQDLNKGNLDSNDLYNLVTKRLVSIHYELMDN